jgi:hypothetical protein
VVKSGVQPCQPVVDAHLAELVLDDGDALAVVRGQDVVNQGQGSLRNRTHSRLSVTHRVRDFHTGLRGHHSLFAKLRRVDVSLVSRRPHLINTVHA